VIFRLFFKIASFFGTFSGHLFLLYQPSFYSKKYYKIVIQKIQKNTTKKRGKKIKMVITTDITTCIHELRDIEGYSTCQKCGLTFGRVLVNGTHSYDKRFDSCSQEVEILNQMGTTFKFIECNERAKYHRLLRLQNTVELDKIRKAVYLQEYLNELKIILKDLECTCIESSCIKILKKFIKIRDEQGFTFKIPKLIAFTIWIELKIRKNIRVTNFEELQEIFKQFGHVLNKSDFVNLFLKYKPYLPISLYRDNPEKYVNHYLNELFSLRDFRQRLVAKGLKLNCREVWLEAIALLRTLNDFTINNNNTRLIGFSAVYLAVKRLNRKAITLKFAKTHFNINASTLYRYINLFE